MKNKRASNQKSLEKSAEKPHTNHSERNLKMTQPLSKKQIAAAAGITPRTMQRNRREWQFVDEFACRGTRRARYRAEVLEECRRRKMI